tara:strand:+ start:136 stop:237 length:102 start_codon:yes stop_codon:yes gene_type:complete
MLVVEVVDVMEVVVVMALMVVVNTEVHQTQMIL